VSLRLILKSKLRKRVSNPQRHENANPPNAAAMLANPRYANAVSRNKKPPPLCQTKKEVEMQYLEPAQRVRVGDACSALNVGLHLRRGNPRAGEISVPGEGGVGVETLVDDARHSVLAVRANILSAVEPNGGLVLDDNLEDFARLALGDGEEAGKEGARVLWLAGRAKGGLDDGMVAGSKVELYYLADLSHDVVGIEFQSASADNDGVGDFGLGVSLGWDFGVGSRGSS
jgi:hypothetical protein